MLNPGESPVFVVESLYFPIDPRYFLLMSCSPTVIYEEQARKILRISVLNHKNDMININITSAKSAIMQFGFEVETKYIAIKIDQLRCFHALNLILEVKIG